MAINTISFPIRAAVQTPFVRTAPTLSNRRAGDPTQLAVMTVKRLFISFANIAYFNPSREKMFRITIRATGC